VKGKPGPWGPCRIIFLENMAETGIGN